MKKSKGQTIDLLYSNKKDISKKTKSKSNKSKNTTKNKNAKTKKTQNNDNIINLDKEIIIGLTPRKEEEKEQKNTVNKKTDNKKTKAKNKKVTPQKIKKDNSKSITKKENKKKKRKIIIIKWILIVVVFCVTIILFMMSSVFNIKEIVVVNNNKISSQEILNLSTLTTGVNMFKITNRTIREGIKTNAYIEDVVIKRNINGIVTLDIKERQATYMLKYLNEYVYINNQGYMLEISEDVLQVPVIKGFSTTNEEIKAGNRLNTDDLQKLDDVIKIIETSKNTPLVNIITEIDISNSSDYKLTITSENKTVRLGEMTNINIKLQMAGKVFEAESGKVGEIYFQDDGKKAVFKEHVARW